jgi:hypothetical protein
MLGLEGYVFPDATADSGFLQHEFNLKGTFDTARAGFESSLGQGETYPLQTQQSP